MKYRPRHIEVLSWLFVLSLGIAYAAKAADDIASPQSTAVSKAQLAEEARIVAGLPSVPAGLNHHYALETTPRRRIDTVYTYAVEVPRMTVEQWILFSPKPPDLPGQEIVRADCIPKGVVVEDRSPLHQPLFRATVPVPTPAPRHGIQFQVDIEAKLFARKLVSREQAPAVKGLSAKQRSLALRPTRQFNYVSPQMREWMRRNELTRSPREGEVDFARRVFQTIARGFQYEYTGDAQDRSAPHVCMAGKSDCGGLSTLFATALRSQGIPARTLAGRWARSAKPGQLMDQVVYFQEHVKAEFFAQGVGWVPVDVSSAVERDRTSERLVFFGNDPGDFLTLHLDSDLSCGAEKFVKTFPLLQKAAYVARGNGDFKGLVIRESWTASEVQ